MKIRVFNPDECDSTLEQLKEKAVKCVEDGVKGIKIIGLANTNTIAVDIYQYPAKSGDSDEAEEVWALASDEFEEFFLKDFIEKGL